MAGKGMKPLSPHEPTTQVNFKITPHDLLALDKASDEMGVDRSKYIRMCISANNNSNEHELNKLEREVRELELELSLKNFRIKEIKSKIEASKSAVDDREQAIKQNIEDLLPTLRSEYGDVNKIKDFINQRVININNNFNGNGINPITTDEFTQKFIEYAEAQGMICK